MSSQKKSKDTTDFGLSSKALKEARAILAAHPKVVKAVVYGSRAMGNYRDTSDIDLTLFGEGLKHEDAVKIAGIFDDSNIPYEVDLSIYAKLTNADLKEHIDREGKVFYDRNGGWRTVRLGEVCDIEMGKTPSRSNASYWDKDKASGNVWVSIADLSALEGKYISDSKEYVSNAGASLCRIVLKNTLLMSFKLSIGKLAFAGKDLRTNEAIVALTIIDEEQICKEYLYYALSSIDWDSYTKGDVKVKGKTLNKTKLKEVMLLLPPLLEQQRIVAKLDATFAEIAKASEATSLQLAELESLKQSVLADSLRFKGGGGST